MVWRKIVGYLIMSCCGQKTGCAHKPHKGSAHWLMERLTSVALIPLTLWVVYSIETRQGSAHIDFVLWLQDPLNAFLLMATVMIMYYHACMGVEVIVDDYISCPTTNCVATLFFKAAFAVMGIASVVSIVKVAF
jgi:succinate dehydrogenase / fumarate reductase membrane anchor subunit